jgi:hypothetical protein
MKKAVAQLIDQYRVSEFAPLLALLVLLATSGVSFKYSIFSIFLVGSHSVFGSFVYSKYIAKHRCGHISGIGFAIGTLAAIVIDQIFVTTPLREKSWVIIPLASLAFIIHRSRNNVIQLVPVKSQIPWLMLVFLSLVGLIQERFWPLWVALGMVPLIAITNFPVNKLRRTLICSTAFISVLTFMEIAKNRPQLWWIKTQDFQFFESLSYSLAHWGWRDQIYATGNPVYYHWLTFAWTGMFTRIMNAPNWLMLSRIAPPIIILFVILLLNEIFDHFSLTRIQKTMILLILLLLNDLNFESPSMIFSYLFLLAFLIVASEFLHSEKLLPAIVAAMLGGASLASKSSNIAILAGGLIGIFVYGWKYCAISLSKIISFIAVCGTALIAIFYLFYFSSPYSGNIELGFAGISRDFYGDLKYLSRSSFIIWSFIVVLNLMIFYGLAILVMMRQREMRSSIIFWYFVCATPFSLLPLLVLYSVHQQEEYFYHSWTFVGSIIFLVYMAQLVIPRIRSSNFKSLAIRVAALVIITSCINFFLHDDRSGSVQAIELRVIRGSLMIQLLSVFLVLAVGEFMVRRKTLWSNWFASLFTSGIVILIISLNSQWISNQQQFLNEVTSSTHNGFMLGTADDIQIGKSISSMTPEDAIIASNYFCDEQCDVSNYSQNRADWSVGGEAMFLSVYSHRRFLVTGYGYMWQNVPPSQDVINRIDISLRFGSQPSEESLRELLAYNVAYFVVDKTMTETRDWSQFGSTISSNNRYVLLQLKSVS